MDISPFEYDELVVPGPEPVADKTAAVAWLASLHVFNHLASQLLDQRQPTPPTDDIEKTTLLGAIDYVTWAESQKEIFVKVNIVTI